MRIEFFPAAEQDCSKLPNIMKIASWDSAGTSFTQSLNPLITISKRDGSEEKAFLHLTLNVQDNRYGGD